jgi:hypothetical protein
MKKYTQKDYIKNNIDLSNIETFDDYIVATVEGYVKNGNPVDKWMFRQYKLIIAHKSNEELINDALSFSDTIYNKESEPETKTISETVKKASFFKRMWNSITRKNK